LVVLCKRKLDLQDYEFAWLDDEHAGRHQHEANGEHCGGGEVEAAEQE